MNRFFLAATLAIFLLPACSSDKTSSQNSKISAPSWYISPKQNDGENLYGVAEGFTLEDATKYALADAASRLIVTVSGESTLLREENKTGANEEMRQQVRQNIEKISFTNFKITNSESYGQKFFAEVKIERSPFINQQKEQLSFKQKQADLLIANSSGKNPIQRRTSLLKILDLEKQVELASRILIGAGENINLKETLNRIATTQDQLDKISDKIEFYFEINSPKEISKIIRNSLNKEKIKITPNRNPSNQNQITVRINSSSKSSEIYNTYITKLKIDFENSAAEKIVASNSLEVSGSSSISEKESYSAALQSLEEKISQDGILKILGIIN